MIRATELRVNLTRFARSLTRLELNSPTNLIVLRFRLLMGASFNAEVLWKKFLKKPYGLRDLRAALPIEKRLITRKEYMEKFAAVSEVL